MRNNLAVVVDAGSPRPELTPARAALAAHLRLIEDAKTVAARALQPCARLRAAIDTERQAEMELQAIVDAEALAMARWAESGEGEMPTARSAEREAAESKLADARQRADAARAVLPQLEQSRNDADRRIIALNESARPLIRVVMIEHAAEVAKEMAGALLVVCRAAQELSALDLLIRDAAMNPKSAVFGGPPIGAERVGHGNLVGCVGFDLPGMRRADLPADLRDGLAPNSIIASQGKWIAFANALAGDANAQAPQSGMEG